MSNRPLTFDQRACFIAGPDKSGTTLMCALLDGHPSLATFPEETNYMRTVLPRMGDRPLKERFDYLTREGPSRLLFSPTPHTDNRYADFPRREYLAAFAAAVEAPDNRGRDLLVLMIETLLNVRNIAPESITRWVEKTPDNAYCIRRIGEHFPDAKIIVMMRDPRGKFAAHLDLMRKSGQNFAAFNNIRNWLQTAALLRVGGKLPGNLHVVRFEELLANPEPVLRGVCGFLEIPYDPVVLSPTKAGESWGGNSASLNTFRAINPEPADRWKKMMSPSEIAWVELHCMSDMRRLGYQPVTSGGFYWRWFARFPEERLAAYIKARWYSLRELLTHRFSRSAENYP